MSDTTVNDGVARTTRTGVWLGAAETIVQFVEAFVTELDEAEHVALLATLTLVVNLCVGLYENHRGKGLFLRQVPPREAPVGGE